MMISWFSDPMKKLLPEALGLTGFGLLFAGLYLQLGAGVAMAACGPLMMGAAYMAAKAVRI